MEAELLIEIGTEELPYLPFIKEVSNIKKSWQNILEESGLASHFEFYYTPRRIVFYHKNFPLKCKDSITEFFGPPLSIAYNNNEFTKAGLSFINKCETKEENISTIKKGNSEVLYYKKKVIGSDCKLIIPNMISELIASIHFKKVMKWGSYDFKFIRPIRWLSVVLDDENLDVNLFNLSSKKETRVHRLKNFTALPFNNISEYFELLKDGCVILNQAKRKDKILDDISSIESSNNLKVEIDNNLLSELVMINEYPTALMGTFPKKFLTLPTEVIVTSMKENQKYFAVYDQNGKLSNHFVMVTNNIDYSSSEIVTGNEKVLIARLSDGLFFYENDLKSGLDIEKLKQITFTKELGSIYEKELREFNICKYLAIRNKEFDLDENLLNRAIMYSKADLATDMVYEFTELQGIMGYYYAKALNFEDEISLAIKEHYLPNGEKSELPSTVFSSFISLSNKIDLVLSIFSIKKIPTGSKDPFGLRRAINGIIKIVLKYSISFGVNDLINLSKDYNLSRDLVKRLIDFYNERVISYYENINVSIIKSVLTVGSSDLCDIDKRIYAINILSKKSEFGEYISLFKRVGNVVKEFKGTTISTSMFNEYENLLYKKFESIESQEYDNYLAKMQSFFILKDALSNFFDNVLVNCDDKLLRKNRQSLVNVIYIYYKDICDVKEITI